jgi:hypothetical protein
MRFDHVVIGVRDFDRAARRLWDDHGLASVAGGRHPAWGTGNRIVPLGPSYLELFGVVDPDRAAESDVGRALLGLLGDEDRAVAWVVAPADLDATAARLGLEVSSGARERPEGDVLRWRSAGFQKALEDPSRPFFIAWDVPDGLHPGRMEAPHRVRPLGISWLEVGGDFAAVRGWLGPEEPGVRVGVRPGPPSILAVGIDTDQGEIVLTRYRVRGSLSAPTTRAWPEAHARDG